jgi:hypothetical protein
MIIPASGAIRKVTKLLEFHEDDFTSGGTTLASRVGDITATFAGVITKDADGMYNATDTTDRSVVTLSGTIPVLSGYLACIGVVKAATAAAATHGTILGDAALGPSFSTTGTSLDDSGSSQITGRSLSALTTSAATIATIGVYDLVDTTSPLGMCCHANSTQMAIDTAFTSLSGGAFVSGPLLPAMSIASFTNSGVQDGRRCK